MAHSPGQNNLLGVQARQLGDGATLLVTEQVVILVRGHVHRRMPHALAHRRQATTFLKESRGEQVSDIINAVMRLAPAQGEILSGR